MNEKQLLERIVWLLGLISDQLELAAVQKEEASEEEYRGFLVDRVAEKRLRLEREES